MAYLVSTDYDAQIKSEILQKVIDGNSTYLSDAEAKAISQAKSRLRVRYDVDTEFAKSGAERNPELVMSLVDMVVYHLHSRINPGQVPELRDKRYSDALNWLEKVAAGDWEPDLSKTGDTDEDGDDDNEVVQAGSLEPRDPYY